MVSALPSHERPVTVPPEYGSGREDRDNNITIKCATMAVLFHSHHHPHLLHCHKHALVEGLHRVLLATLFVGRKTHPAEGPFAKQPAYGEENMGRCVGFRMWGSGVVCS